MKKHRTSFKARMVSEAPSKIDDEAVGRNQFLT
jgi:hypothetical protein